MSVITDILRTANKYDFVRVTVFAALVVALSLATYAVVAKGQAFSLSDFGQGIGAILAGAGVGAWGASKETRVE